MLEDPSDIANVRSSMYQQIEEEELLEVEETELLLVLLVELLVLVLVTEELLLDEEVTTADIVTEQSRI